MNLTIKNYKSTDIYRNAKGNVKEEIRAYKAKHNLDDEGMYLALRLYDLKHTDPNLVKKASTGAQLAAALSGLSLVMVSQSSTNQTAILINAVVFIVFFVLYIGGFTNQFQNEKRAIRKRLKELGVKEEFITEEEKLAKEAKKKTEEEE